MAQPADLALVGGHVADVRTGVLRRAAVVISGDRIAAVDHDTVAAGARQVLDITARVVVPGYIDPHTHIVLANPVEFAGALLPTGTTTAVADALPLQILVRPDRLPALLERLAGLPMSLRWQIRLHPPAFSWEERFGLADLRALWRLPSVAAVGEVTNWRDVHDGAPDLMAKIAAAQADGMRVEGHAPGASFERLTVLAAAGFTSCHEAVTPQEALDRLRAGLYVMLRHSPIRPDLPQLAQAVTPELHDSPRLMLTADGPSPIFIDEQGYMDHVVRTAIQSGIPPLVALRMATLNVATYYGMADRGEAAAGRRADLNVLRDIADPRPEIVIAGGWVVIRDGEPAVAPPAAAWDQTVWGPTGWDQAGWAQVFAPVHLPRLAPEVFAPRDGIPVCRLVNDVITEPTDAPAGPSVSAGTLLAALVDREGRWITRCGLAGYADRLGGLASTVNTAFDLLVVGNSPADMAAAVARVADLGGGLAIVEDGRELLALPLDLGGAFSSRPWAEVVAANRRFNALLRDRGYRFGDPLFSLMFLAFDSLPWIRLTSRGVWDVRRRRVLAPSVPL